MRPRVFMSALAMAVLFGSATPAFAGSFAPGADLASVNWDLQEQGDSSTTLSSISSDGAYVVIDTRATNFYDADDADPSGLTRRGGIFRYDVQTKELDTVADGDFFNDSNVLVTRGAHNPSVSANGRYIVFSTRQQIVPADNNNNIDVYVRDMNAPKSSPSSYELVSTRDSGTTPAGYVQASDSGADVFPGRAISADGRRVVFRTTQVSDLPSAGSANVPAGQAFMRDLDDHTTVLLTRQTGTSQPVGGAQFPVVISADGSTAAWVGQNAPAQTPFLAGEGQSGSVSYYLWRRVDDGPSAPTRRITGMADPDDPACDGTPVGFDTSATGPCYGPLTAPEGTANISTRAPALSADGYDVAFLAGAALRPNSSVNQGLDLFVTSMREGPGLTRKSTTFELTRDTISGDPATSGAIESVNMSPDGRWLTLTSPRVRFLLPALTATGPAFRPLAELSELYVVDLTRRTIERGVRSSNGGDSTGEVSPNPSISGDGNRVTFVSSAGNLFFGDSNGAPDSFLVQRSATDESTGQPVDPGVPILTVSSGEDDSPLGASAKRLKDGRLQVSARLPGKGKLTVFATTKGSKKRTVARATKNAGAGGAVRVNLTLKGKDKTRIRKGKSLSVSVRLRFVPDPSGTALTELLDTRFAKAKASSKKSGKGS